jgi:hypothetical protein
MRIELAREHGPSLGIERRREAWLTPIEKSGEPAKSKKVSQPVRRNDLDLVLVPAHRPSLVFVEPGRRAVAPGRILEQSASWSGQEMRQTKIGAAVS